LIVRKTMERNTDFDPTEVSSAIIQGLSGIRDKEQISQQFGSQLWEVEVQRDLSWLDLLRVIEVAEEGGHINADSASLGYCNAALNMAS